MTMKPEEIELKALEYGRETCDCPTWFDYLGYGNARGMRARGEEPQKRVNCWRCRVRFDKKYKTDAHLVKLCASVRAVVETTCPNCGKYLQICLENWTHYKEASK